MPKILIEQYIKEVEIDTDEYEDLGCIQVKPTEFTYIVKFERQIGKGKTVLKISYRDVRTKNDYKMIHESTKKEDYKKFVNFLKKRGYLKL